MPLILLCACGFGLFTSPISEPNGWPNPSAPSYQDWKTVTRFASSCVLETSEFGCFATRMKERR